MGRGFKIGHCWVLLYMEFGEKDESERMRFYRKFVYATGVMESGKGLQIKENIIQKERKKD